MSPLDPSLLEGGRIYKQPVTCHITELLELVEEHFESCKKSESFRKKATEEQFSREVSSDGLLKVLSWNYCWIIAE